MLDGSENEVTGLLGHLFTEGQEIPYSEAEDPQTSRSGPERNEKVLDAIEAFKKADASGDKLARDDAFANLMDTPGEHGETANHALSKAVGALVSAHGVARGISHVDGENIKQDSLIYILDRIACAEKGCYDPSKARFNAWVTTVVEGRAKMHYRHMAGQKEVGAGDDSKALDVELSRHKDLSHGPSWDFTADEEKLCSWLSKYLTKVKDGTEPFPYDVKASLRLAGAESMSSEERAKLRRTVEHGFVVAFMHNNGLGLPKLNYMQIDAALAKYGMGAGTRLNATKQAKNAWYTTMWKALKPLIFVSEKSIGLEGDPEQVFDMFRLKLQKFNVTSAARGRTACEDDLSNGLYDLLAVLESWHEPANS